MMQELQKSGLRSQHSSQIFDFYFDVDIKVIKLGIQVKAMSENAAG